jgi:hypothetical protein
MLVVARIGPWVVVGRRVHKSFQMKCVKRLALGEPTAFF